MLSDGWFGAITMCVHQDMRCRISLITAYDSETIHSERYGASKTARMAMPNKQCSITTKAERIVPKSNKKQLRYHASSSPGYHPGRGVGTISTGNCSNWQDFLSCEHCRACKRREVQHLQPQLSKTTPFRPSIFCACRCYAD